MSADFDIQSFLADMRHELTTKIDGLTTDVRQLTAQGAEYNLRITMLERFQQKTQWVIGVVVTAIIGAVVSLFTHRPTP